MKRGIEFSPGIIPSGSHDSRDERFYRWYKLRLNIINRLEKNKKKGDDEE